jgi:hypothetical protein
MVFLPSLHVFHPQNNVPEDHQMAAYTCETCGKCGKELAHSSLTKPDGTTVHISECPDGHGKVKSPMCCGQDMSCPV